MTRSGRSLQAAAAALVAAALLAPAGAADYLPIPAATLQSALRLDKGAPVPVPAFRMRATPVSNAEFLAFVRSAPQWRRSRVPRVFADAAYLESWQGDLELGPLARPEQPVTGVSWFAARAYCAAEQARLPDWVQWELVAAADATRRDARADPAWRARILEWYARPTGELADVGGAPNAYGVRDLHGLVWEWVEDAQSLLVQADSRNQDGAEALPFCGGAALSLRDPGDFASAMRVALISSLQAADTVRSLGFRCVRTMNEVTP